MQVVGEREGDGTWVTLRVTLVVKVGEEVGEEVTLLDPDTVSVPLPVVLGQEVEVGDTLRVVDREGEVEEDGVQVPRLLLDRVEVARPLNVL